MFNNNIYDETISEKIKNIIYLSQKKYFLKTTQEKKKQMRQKRNFSKKMSKEEKNLLSVISYNILAPELCNPEWNHTCNPQHLEKEYRLELLLEYLCFFVENKSVICLQEVSYTWAGKIITFFQQYNYYTVYTPYGNYFNGFMGVLSAFPQDLYQLENCDISQIGGTSKYKYEKPEKKTCTTKFWNFFFRKEEEKKIKQKNDLIKESLYKKNAMISLQLLHLPTNKKVWICNYHMPCSFDKPLLMNIHALLVKQHVLRLCSYEPFVLVGDFNMKVGSEPYQIITEKKYFDNDPDLQPFVDPFVDPELFDFLRFEDVYQKKIGKISCTTWANTKKFGEFKDVIDYIFYDSLSLKPEKVLDIPIIKTECPNSDEPSDHISIGATFSFSHNNDEFSPIIDD